MCSSFPQVSSVAVTTASGNMLYAAACFPCSCSGVARKRMQPCETSATPGLPTAAVGQATMPESRCQVFFSAKGMEHELMLPTVCVRPLMTSPRMPNVSSFMPVKRDDAAAGLMRYDEANVVGPNRRRFRRFAHRARHGPRRNIGDAHSVERKHQSLVGVLRAAGRIGQRHVLPPMEIEKSLFRRLLFRIGIENVKMHRMLAAVGGASKVAVAMSPNRAAVCLQP